MLQDKLPRDRKPECLFLVRDFDDTILVKFIGERDSYRVTLEALKIYIKAFLQKRTKVLDYLWNFKRVFYYPETDRYYMEAPKRLTGLTNEITGRVIPFCSRNHSRAGKYRNRG